MLQLYIQEFSYIFRPNFRYSRYTPSSPQVLACSISILSEAFTSFSCTLMLKTSKLQVLQVLPAPVRLSFKRDMFLPTCYHPGVLCLYIHFSQEALISIYRCLSPLYLPYFGFSFWAAASSKIPFWFTNVFAKFVSCAFVCGWGGGGRFSFGLISLLLNAPKLVFGEDSFHLISP